MIYLWVKVGHEVLEEKVKVARLSDTQNYCRSTVPDFKNRHMMLHPSLKITRVDEEERWRLIT